MPLNMLPSRLKAIIKAVPDEHMRTYDTVWPKASSGACIMRDIWAEKVTNTAVQTTAIMAKSAMPVPITLPPTSLLPSPIFCPSNMVMPIEKLVSTNVRLCIIWLPVATPETSAVEANLPTISRSIAPYIACKNSARKTGYANLSSGPSIFPLVKLFMDSIIASVKSRTRNRAHPTSYPAL